MYNLDRSILRILRTSDGATVGTGFLLAPDLAVTCAHVVTAAQCAPGGYARVRLYAGGDPQIAQVLSEGFSPKEAEDAAFLRLSAPLPGAEPAPLAPAAAARPGDPFTTLGFPNTPVAAALRPYGTINGVIPMRRNGVNMLQIAGGEIYGGISGAPVFAPDLGCVVGMVAEGWDAPNGRIAFAVTTETLARLHPGLQLQSPAAPGLPPLPDPAELPEPAALPGGSHLPLPRNALFTGRGAELKNLAGALLWGHERTAIAQPAGIAGLGGVGKTQLAVEFAYRYGRFFEGVHWLPAAHPSDLAPAVAACGLAMGVQPWPEKQPEQVAATLRAWAASRRRLVILDNLEDPGLLAEWLPRLGAMRVLVTTRRADWPGELGMQVYPLDTLPRADSLALLRRLAPHLVPLPDVSLDSLAARLGDLPLALDLAGRYLHELAPLTPEDFLAGLNQSSALAHPALVDWTASTPTRHAPSLMATFTLSWERLGGEGPVETLARRVFFTAGWCAPNAPIPPEVLSRAAGLEAADPAFRRALKRLMDLGLLESAPEGPLLHPLLAEFAQRLQGEDTGPLAALADALAALSTQALETGLPAAFVPLRPHLEACAPAAEAHGVEPAGALWNNLGLVLRDLGELPAARQHFERALSIAERVYGPQHPTVATVLNNLGSVLQALGELPAARQHFERALTILEGSLPPTHPHLQIIRNNLAALEG